jgi:DNA-directed RNA polymerase specialized sigma24 family protein
MSIDAALRAAAEAGDAEAQFRLGLALAHGGGEAAEAARWCEAAARQGHAAAQFNCGLLAVQTDPEAAVRWLRLAALNGVVEAEACLDLVYRDGALPRTWEEADTRASVALAGSDPQAPKRVRLAEYYVDPCLDLLVRRHRIDRDQAEEIVQQFFLELEEPLAKGGHRGQAWKQALRDGYQAERGAFRPYLRRTLVNFARDWMRGRRTAAPVMEPALSPEAEAERLAHEWRPLLERFAATVSAAQPAYATAVAALHQLLGDGATQSEVAARSGRSPRSVRTDLRLGGELLHDWLGREIELRAGRGRLAEPLRRGLELLPEWLHFPSADKRAKCLLLLALLARAES